MVFTTSSTKSNSVPQFLNTLLVVVLIFVVLRPGHQQTYQTNKKRRLWDSRILDGRGLGLGLLGGSGSWGSVRALVFCGAVLVCLGLVDVWLGGVRGLNR